MVARILALLTNQVLIFGLQIVASILTARLLGPQQRGVLVVAMLIAMFVSAFAVLGMPNALVYNLSKSSDPQREISRSIGYSLCVMLVSTMLVVAFYSLAYLSGRGSMLKGLAPLVVVGSLIFCIVNSAQGLILGILSGLQEFRWRIIVLTLPTLVQLAVLTYCWRSACQITVLMIIWVNILSVSIALLLCSVHIRNRYRPEVSLRLPDDWKQNYAMYGLKGYAGIIAQCLNNRLDTLIVNTLMGSLSVGIYSTGVSCAEFLLLMPDAAAVVLYPKIASLPAGEQARASILTVGGSFYLVLGSGIVWAAVLPTVVPHFYGTAFAASVPAAQWLILGMLALTLVKTLSSVVAALGRPEYVTCSFVAGLLGTVSLDFLLIPRFGIVGAAWAALVSYWLSALTILVLYTRLTTIPLGEAIRRLVTDPVVWLRQHGWQQLSPVRLFAHKTTEGYHALR
jgi:O-antigen/teichoic acid export membrane protein